MAAQPLLFALSRNEDEKSLLWGLVETEQNEPDLNLFDLA